MEVGVQSILFQHPCNIFITGPSGCGKTEFVHKLIDYRKDLFNIEPERVVWCYKEWQQTYSLMQEKFNSQFNSQFEFIKFVEGIPMDENEIVSDVSIPHLIVFDDMLGEKDEEKIKLWFTRKGHHRNASVIYITQNMFQQSKSSRTISLNSKYMILFRNERDKNQIKTLAQQMQTPHLLLAYEDATCMDHGYLVIDFHSRTNKELRLRTDIFHRWYTEGDSRGPIVYSSA